MRANHYEKHGNPLQTRASFVPVLQATLSMQFPSDIALSPGQAISWGRAFLRDFSAIDEARTARGSFGRPTSDDAWASCSPQVRAHVGSMVDGTKCRRNVGRLRDAPCRSLSVDDCRRCRNPGGSSGPGVCCVYPRCCGHRQ